MEGSTGSKIGACMIEMKTLKYLDVLEVLKEVEKESKRPGLKRRVWIHLCDNGNIHNDTMTYINTEDSHELLVADHGEELGNDLEAIKQAVSHIPIEEISWFATW